MQVRKFRVSFHGNPKFWARCAGCTRWIFPSEGSNAVGYMARVGHDCPKQQQTLPFAHRRGHPLRDTSPRQPLHQEFQSLFITDCRETPLSWREVQEWSLGPPPGAAAREPEGSVTNAGHVSRRLYWRGSHSDEPLLAS